jgi:hypothetical protein
VGCWGEPRGSARACAGTRLDPRRVHDCELIPFRVARVSVLPTILRL